ncbi:hypothetical protein [Bradyrhizobium sp. CCBAU 53338]|uniref:hypothetical protein n=1 Tax=Bradyrhizobium sp. CCBAU 53338 TaxID=1325111 RepID=UPI00188C5B27|nr:hypothetical protein [Bradyrhizobium sp. CCBAU 53338]
MERFSLSVEDIAQVIPATDRVFAIRGLKAGRLMMTAYAPTVRSSTAPTSSWTRPRDW